MIVYLVVTIGLVAGADAESKFCVVGAGAGGIQVCLSLEVCKLQAIVENTPYASMFVLRCVIHQLRSVTFCRNLLAKNTRLVYQNNVDLLKFNMHAETYPYLLKKMGDAIIFNNRLHLFVTGAFAYVQPILNCYTERCQIFEAKDIAAPFFKTLPRHRSLIRYVHTFFVYVPSTHTNHYYICI